jgi:F0F1-type ATP synthase membrane subunit b/b'
MQLINIIQILILILAGTALFQMEGTPNASKYSIRHSDKDKGKIPQEAKEITARNSPGDFTVLLSEFQDRADQIIVQMKDESSKQAQEISRFGEDEINRIRAEIQQQFHRETSELVEELRYEISWLSMIIDDNLRDLNEKKKLANSGITSVETNKS